MKVPVIGLIPLECIFSGSGSGVFFSISFSSAYDRLSIMPSFVQPSGSPDRVTQTSFPFSFSVTICAHSPAEASENRQAAYGIPFETSDLNPEISFSPASFFR